MTYPIHFDVRIAKSKSFLLRFFTLLPLPLFFWLFWERDPHHAIAAMWFGISMIAITLIIALIIRIKNGKHFNKPKFSLYEDKLFVKDAFSNIIEYPIENFDNEVIIKKQWLELYIDVPNMRSIHISCLEKADREKLIGALKRLVETKNWHL